MIRAYRAEQIRAAEAPLLAAGQPLMRRAAHAVADAGRRALAGIEDPVVLVLVGGGNNGGDGLFAAAELASAARVSVVLAHADPHAEGLAAATAAGVEIIDVSHAEAGDAVLGKVHERAQAADVWIDALAGIGVRGPLRGASGRLVELLVAQRAGAALEPTVIAVDIPSGVDADTGAAGGPVLAADLTVTFGAPKAGLLLPPGTGLAGQVRTIPLGIDALLATQPAAVARLTDADAAELWPVPEPDAHKYSRGVVGVLAGSVAYPGAAVLTVGAAVRAGCGMVRYLGPDAPTALVLRSWPEVVTGPGRVQAWVVGPGLDGADEQRQAEAAAAIGSALADRVPLVVDAGALGLLPPAERVAGCPVVLTPHAGELAALLSARGEAVTRAQVEADPGGWAVRAADLTGASVLAKGPVTVVAAPDGEVYSQADGTRWLATAGAGDVLAGVLGALLATMPGRSGLQVPAARVAALAALVHGRAAVRASGGGPIAASDVVTALPGMIAGLLAGTLSG